MPVQVPALRDYESQVASDSRLSEAHCSGAQAEPLGSMI